MAAGGKFTAVMKVRDVMKKLTNRYLDQRFMFDEEMCQIPQKQRRYKETETWSLD